MEKTNFTNLPDDSTIPAAYVLHYYTTHCQHCNAQSSRSDFYALHMLRGRMDKTPARHLKACAKPLYNVPVEKLNVGHRLIPYCADCLSVDLSHLPSPPQAAQLHDIAGPALREAAPRKPTTSHAAQPRKATLGDLA